MNDCEDDERQGEEQRTKEEARRKERSEKRRRRERDERGGETERRETRTDMCVHVPLLLPLFSIFLLSRVININPNKMLGVIGGHLDFPIERIRVSRDKKMLASCSHDNLVKFWSLEDAFDDQNKSENTDENNNNNNNNGGQVRERGAEGMRGDRRRGDGQEEREGEA